MCKHVQTVGDSTRENMAIEARNQKDVLHCPPDFTQGGTAALFNLMIIKLNKQIISSGTAPFIKLAVLYYQHDYDPLLF